MLIGTRVERRWHVRIRQFPAGGAARRSSPGACRPKPRPACRMVANLLSMAKQVSRRLSQMALISRGMPSERRWISEISSAGKTVCDGIPAFSSRRGDVLGGLGFLERSQVAAKHDALLQLPEIRRIQLPLQFGLTGQDDLEELPAPVLQVTQQAGSLPGRPTPDYGLRPRSAPSSGLQFACWISR